MPYHDHSAWPAPREAVVAIAFARALGVDIVMYFCGICIGQSICSMPALMEIYESRQPDTVADANNASGGCSVHHHNSVY